MTKTVSVYTLCTANRRNKTIRLFEAVLRSLVHNAYGNIIKKKVKRQKEKGKIIEYNGASHSLRGKIINLWLSHDEV